MLLLIEQHAADVQAIYLFGSTARGDETKESDIDIAVLAARPLDPIPRWHLQEAIAAKLGKQVDLVDLRSASTVMRAQVLRDGRQLFVKDPTIVGLFEATALSDYARLQEERGAILKDIANRGTIRG